MVKRFFIIIMIVLLSAGSALATVELDANGDGIIDLTYIPYIDEDSMATDSATKLPTQQSVKAYVDNSISGLFSGIVNADEIAVFASGTTFKALTESEFKAAYNMEAGTDYLAPNGDGSSLTGLTWSQVGSTPTTLAGYGITDAESSTSNDFDPDRLAGDTTDNDLIDPAIGGLGIDASSCTGHVDWSSGTVTCVKDAFSQTTDPTLDDDTLEGYSVGSLWYNMTGAKIYRLLDASEGAANWDCITCSSNTALDNIADPTVDASIELGSSTLTLKSISDGWGGIVVYSNVADNASDTYLMTLQADDADDANTHYLRVMEDVDGTPTTLFEFYRRSFLIGSLAKIEGIGEIHTTGELTGKLEVQEETGTTIDVAEATHYGGIVSNGDADAVEVDLDAAVVGMSLMVVDNGGGVITLTPNGTDTIVYDGTEASAGEAILSSGTKYDYASLICLTANQWIVVGHDTNGWVEATP
jgi:hypothetical protein